jgi:hypothetical protein
MPTIVVTQGLARAIEHLRARYRINKIKRRRLNPYYLWVNESRTGDHGVHVPEAVVKQLEQMKLIDGGDLNPREVYFRGTRRVYRASDQCVRFCLPPEEFWVRE